MGLPGCKTHQACGIAKARGSPHVKDMESPRIGCDRPALEPWSPKQTRRVERRKNMAVAIKIKRSEGQTEKALVPMFPLTDRVPFWNSGFLSHSPYGRLLSCTGPFTDLSFKATSDSFGAKGSRGVVSLWGIDLYLMVGIARMLWSLGHRMSTVRPRKSTWNPKMVSQPEIPGNDGLMLIYRSENPHVPFQNGRFVGRLRRGRHML